MKKKKYKNRKKYYWIKTNSDFWGIPSETGEIICSHVKPSNAANMELFDTYEEAFESWNCKQIKNALLATTAVGSASSFITLPTAGTATKTFVLTVPSTTSTITY